MKYWNIEQSVEVKKEQLSDNLIFKSANDSIETFNQELIRYDNATVGFSCNTSNIDQVILSNNKKYITAREASNIYILKLI